MRPSLLSRLLCGCWPSGNAAATLDASGGMVTIEPLSPTSPPTVSPTEISPALEATETVPLQQQSSSSEANSSPPILRVHEGQQQ